MAFTHYTPTAQRIYGEEYSYSTGIPNASSIFSRDYSVTNTNGATRSQTYVDKQVRSYDSDGSYESRFFTRSSSGLDGSNGAEYDYGKSYSSTESFYEFDNYLSSSLTGSGENGSTSSYASQATGEGQSYAGGGAFGQTASSVSTELSQFNSTYIVYTTSRSASRSSSASYTIQTGDGDGNTGVSNVNLNGGFSSYYYLESGRTVTQSAGNTQVVSTSISSSSGYTTTDNTRVIPPQSDGTVTGTSSTQFGRGASYRIATALSTYTYNNGYPSTVTTSKSFSYSSSSSNLIETESSSYSVKTTTRDFYSPNYTYVRSSEQYTTESEVATERAGKTYGLYTIHGGAGYISGGDTLDNGVITGATYGSIFSAPLVSQPTEFNTVTKHYYQGDSQTLTLTTWRASYASDDVVNTLIQTSSNISILTTTSSGLTETVDFGRLTSSAKVFTNITAHDFYYGEGNSRGQSYYSTTTSFADNKSTVFSGYTTTTFNRSRSYVGIDGFSTFTWLSNVFSNTTYETRFNVGDQNTGLQSRITYKETVGASQRKAQSATATGFLTYIDYSNKIITLDKGRQGGVQYEKSSDVSGAVRSTRSMTIADEVITSTTYTSPAATINITGNTAESNSYTYSAGLALGLELKLNRYLSYFPNERYGDIVSSIDSMQYSYSDEGIGSSIIRFSSTGIYSTTKSGTAGSSLNTQSFSSELFGIVKPGLGGVYAEGQRTALKASYFDAMFESPKAILGGQKFTDETGIYEYGSQNPPYSFYAFGSSDSSLITQAIGDIITGSDTLRTISLPAQSVIFNPVSSFLVAAGNAQTYDRNQIRDYDGYYSSYYYGPYPYY
jgi:hypothetical protein